MDSKKDRIIRVRLSEDMYNHLINKSNITGNTISDIIRECIRKYINK